MSSKKTTVLTLTHEAITRPATATSKGGLLVGSIPLAAIEKALGVEVGSCWIQNGFVCFQQKNAKPAKANAIQLG